MAKQVGLPAKFFYEQNFYREISLLKLFKGWNTGFGKIYIRQEKTNAGRAVGRFVSSALERDTGDFRDWIFTEEKKMGDWTSFFLGIPHSMRSKRYLDILTTKNVSRNH